MNELLTAADLAQILKVHISDICAMVQNHNLPVVRIGARRLRFRVADVERWLSERSAQSGQETQAKEDVR